MSTREAKHAPFVVQQQGEKIEALAEGVDRAHLQRLLRGEVEIDGDLDLHGLDRREARFLVRAELREAYSRGERCIRIVHGRGHHSELEPVLKQALPDWLRELPLGRLVLAFASAPPAEGGPGATLVLLRRRR